MMSVLIVEKDAVLGRRVQSVLDHAGYNCVLAQTISRAEALVDESPPSIVILGARMPWTLCYPFLMSLEAINCPILFISHDAQSRDHLLKLYHYLADVLLRPFDGRQLLIKVECLLKETSEHRTRTGLYLDLEQKAASLDGKPLALTAQEFALLVALMQSPDTAISRQELLKNAWGYLAVGQTRTVDVHVQRLRRKLGNDRIETVYKQGYRLRLA